MHRAEDYLDKLELDRQNLLQLVKGLGITSLQDDATFSDIADKMTDVVDILESYGNLDDYFNTDISIFNTGYRNYMRGKQVLQNVFKKVPKVSFGERTDFNNFFYDNNYIKDLNKLDFSKADPTKIKKIVSDCNELQYFPQGIADKITDSMESIFLNLRNLQELPDIDTSNVTNISSAFSGLNKELLKELNKYDFSKATGSLGFGITWDTLESERVEVNGNFPKATTLWVAGGQLDNSKKEAYDKQVPKIIDYSGLYTPNLTSLGNGFRMYATLLDLSNVDFKQTQVTESNNPFGYPGFDGAATTGLPRWATIIVKDDEQKDYLLTNFSTGYRPNNIVTKAEARKIVLNNALETYYLKSNNSQSFNIVYKWEILRPNTKEYSIIGNGIIDDSGIVTLTDNAQVNDILEITGSLIDKVGTITDTRKVLICDDPSTQPQYLDKYFYTTCNVDNHFKSITFNNNETIIKANDSLETYNKKEKMTCSIHIKGYSHLDIKKTWNFNFGGIRLDTIEITNYKYDKTSKGDPCDIYSCDIPNPNEEHIITIFLGSNQYSSLKDVPYIEIINVKEANTNE